MTSETVGLLAGAGIILYPFLVGLAQAVLEVRRHR